jgi:hypothetical protein
MCPLHLKNGEFGKSLRVLNLFNFNQMKKIVFIASFSLLALASCKKDYTCTVAGVVVNYPDLDKDEADAAKAACTFASGTWATN